MGGGYFPVNHCVSGEETTTPGDLNNLVHNIMKTCINNHILQHGIGLSLQVSFSFPIFGFEMTFLSVEVVLQGSIDCKSVAWTFVCRLKQLTWKL